MHSPRSHTTPKYTCCHIKTMRLNTLPRANLTVAPTPLHSLPNLTKHLGGPKILVKRDDLTGLAFGGNKARKLEYLMGDALQKKADIIVTEAGFHSNWCTMTAAAARKLGLPIVLVKDGPVDGYDPEHWDGNHLLHNLLGAEITIVKDNRKEAWRKVTENLHDEGCNPYSMPVGGSTPLGAAGYVHAMVELYAQTVQTSTPITHLYHSTGSGGTQAGIVLGAKALNTGIKVVGVSNGSRRRDPQRDLVLDITRKTAEFLEADVNIINDDINVLDTYADGYGHMTPEKAEAIRLCAETEGLLIDPVYTAPVIAAITDQAQNGTLCKDDTVVFLHTGGTAALFPYREPLKAHIQGTPLPWKIPQWSPDYTG
jgi:D-cysteine desulfhydrase family pyridoxal phosphate-dependent enzyme